VKKLTVLESLRLPLDADVLQRKAHLETMIQKVLPHVTDFELHMPMTDEVKDSLYALLPIVLTAFGERLQCLTIRLSGAYAGS
jgi:hypothetical protein